MIEVSQLTKYYGPRMAIQDLTFQVAAGEVVGFLGLNGAGKTTTMKILTGFMPATSGKASVAGFDVFDRPLDVKLNVGYLPETPPLYLEMVVEDYLDFAARLHQVAKDRIGRAIDNALGRTGLGDVRGRLIGNLSKGYRQRVGLAQTLLHNPKVLILDEPTVGLDPRQIIEIRELIKGLKGDHTVILSSHILPEVVATCQRVIIINNGIIVAENSIEKLTTQQQGFVLVVRNASNDGVEAIRRIPGVRAVSTAGGAGRLVIETATGAGDLRGQIMETASGSSMGVLEFYAERLSLEDIFLRLTTGEQQSA